MGPVFNVAYMTSVLTDFAPFSYDIAFVLKVFGFRDFLPNVWEIKFLAQTLCNEYDPLHFLCGDILFVIAGYDIKQLNESRIPVYLSHIPAGTSVQNMLHFVQMYEAKNCSRFNYGSVSENIKHYGTGIPPAYNISKISNTPVTLFYAQHDSLADPKDVQYIIAHLRNIRDVIYVPDWDHLDFLWALDARAVVYEKILTLLKKS